MKRILAAFIALVIAGALSSASSAAEPITINAVLSLTGAAAFLGTAEDQALHALEVLVNGSGGVKGRPIAFKVADDQSNPQMAVQIVSELKAKNVPLALGPGFSQTCGAARAIVESSGPVLYCLSPGAVLKPGGYMFAVAPPFDDVTPVVLRYFKGRGLTRVAVIATTDSSGQDAERSFDLAVKAPDLRDIERVDLERFNAADISVAAQVARVKAARADAILVYAAGPAFGTVMRGIQDAGIELPVYGVGSNMNVTQMQQYAKFLPKELVFNGARGIVQEAAARGALKRAQAVYFDTVQRAGLRADFATQLAWDPAMLLVDALRHVGPDASAEQVHAYLEGLRSWNGIEGSYDFTSGDQRGIHESAVALFRWDTGKGAFVPVYVGGRRL